MDWLLQFAEPVKRVLKPTGSFVLDLGGAYQSGRPVRSLYNFRVMLRLCDEHGFRLAEEFFWHNPAKLPSPIEWVNKRKIRAKDSVNTVWWFAKTDFPKADVRRVLAPYSERMKKLLEDAESFYRPKLRPSGHDISRRFANNNGGAIPSNLLQIPNTESNSPYLRHCATVGVRPHPARFPEKLPTFFIEFLTDPGDTVLDIFAGSNTTGSAAENSTAAGWRSRKTAPTWPHPHSVSWTNASRKSRHALEPTPIRRFAGRGEPAAAGIGADGEAHATRRRPNAGEPHPAQNTTMPPMPQNQEFSHDVFLSHSAKDKPVVRPLAERLRQDGLKVGSMSGCSSPATASRRRSRKGWSTRACWCSACRPMRSGRTGRGWRIASHHDNSAHSPGSGRQEETQDPADREASGSAGHRGRSHDHVHVLSEDSPAMKPTPNPLSQYHVFLASPGDVGAERQYVRRFFDEYNRHTAHIWNARVRGGGLGELRDHRRWPAPGTDHAADAGEVPRARWRWSSASWPSGSARRPARRNRGPRKSSTGRWRATRPSGFPEIKWFFRKVDKLELPADPTRRTRRWTNGRRSAPSASGCRT